MSVTDLPPGLRFVLFRHEDNCPTRHTQSMADCVCSPTLDLVTAAEFGRAVNQTRSERRAAARKAEKAIRRAKSAGREAS